MSKAAALLAGLGIGSASEYMGRKQRDASEARIAAIRSGQPLPKEVRPIDTIIDKVKGAFTTKTPDVSSPSTPAKTPEVADTRPNFNVPLDQQTSTAKSPESHSDYSYTYDAAPVPVITPPVSIAPAAPTPSVETSAFNDDKTVPNEPATFENSYG